LPAAAGGVDLSRIAPWWFFYSSWPSRALRVAARGSWHAMRDVLFPELRRPLAAAGGPACDGASAAACAACAAPEGAAPPPRVQALDWPLADERGHPGDTAARLALRAALLRAADAAGVPALYAARPDVVRVAAGLLLAAALFATLAAMRCAAEALARVALRVLLRATRAAAFVDDGSPAEEALLLRYEDEAARAADADALAARLRAAAAAARAARAEAAPAPAPAPAPARRRRARTPAPTT
jgi:hypothetical protein